MSEFKKGVDILIKFFKEERAWNKRLWIKLREYIIKFQCPRLEFNLNFCASLILWYEQFSFTNMRGVQVFLSHEVHDRMLKIFVLVCCPKGRQKYV